MQDFSPFAKLAEEQLRQPSNYQSPETSDPEHLINLINTHGTMKLVNDTFGSDAIERPGYLFYHASAMQYESCNFEQDSAKYPTMSLSDAELDQLKLKSVDPAAVTQTIGFGRGKMGTLLYKSCDFPKEQDETEPFDAVIGVIRVNKKEIEEIKLPETVIDALANMVSAMTKLQAGLECMFPLNKTDKPTSEFFQSLKKKDKKKLNQLMDDP